jgi:hypothetical protein
MDPRPNYVLIKRFTSKEKLESLCFPGTCYTGHLVLQVGDIIRLGGANVRKDVIVSGSNLLYFIFLVARII